MVEATTPPYSKPVQTSSAETAKLSGDRSPLAVHSYGLTDRGKVRPTNQDQFLIATLVKALQIERTSLPLPPVEYSSDRSHLFVVADGMGGHSAGEEASTLAIDSVETFVLETFKWFTQCKGREGDQVLADFQGALAQANERLLAEADEHPEWYGMGTTLTLAYSLNEVLFIAHVGDSRCYLRRQGALHRLTTDHTMAEELVRRGALSAEEAAKHPWRHMITNAVGGTSPEVKVELHKLHLEAGDTILVCTDGLTGMVTEEEIAHILDSEDDLKQACARLVARANEEGGKDNITVVLAHFVAAA
jgi:serine/threonine protein phosphatase PrpC